ncbi:MAG: hypothetical protein LBL65_03005 [Campylobacteraceae bacterium]|jgi:hypothetical protein|nr:hypothetical protein [Campylobacteraceae bacterium]
MTKVISIAFFLVLQVICYSNELPKDVYGYIELLTRVSEPTLAEYSNYAGECGGESELLFMQSECEDNYNNIFSCECVKFTRDRCKNEKNTTSLELNWIRKNFSTAGKKYNIEHIKRYNKAYNDEGNSMVYNYEIISVKIGDNLFDLYHTLDNTVPGLSLYISNINGSALRIPLPVFNMNESDKLKAYDFINKANDVCKF